MPRWFTTPALQLLKLNGFELRQFEYRGSPVHYVEGGSLGAPLVAVFPGFADNIFSWTRLLLRYSRRFRVVGLDFPGFSGISPHPAGAPLGFADHEQVASDFIGRLGARVDFLIGNSMGGWISLRLAARDPSSIAHLIAINPAGVFTTEAELMRVRDLYDVHSYLDYMRMMRHLWHEMPLYMYPFALGGFYQLSRTPQFRAFFGSIDRSHFINELLPGLSTPISVIWGRGDKLFPETMGRLIAGTAPNARFYPLDEAGHMPQFEAPAKVFELIDRITRPST